MLSSTSSAGGRHAWLYAAAFNATLWSFSAQKLSVFRHMDQRHCSFQGASQECRREERKKGRPSLCPVDFGMRLIANGAVKLSRKEHF